MNLSSTIYKLIVILLLSAAPAAYGQIYSYTNDSAGAYSSVATNAVGAHMGRINSAAVPPTACRYGFSSTNFPAVTTFATALPADTMAVWADAGYNLHITGFSVGIRRSATGPQNVRYAYSVDSGATWVNQGMDQAPNNGNCDSVITAVWTTTVNVTYPHHLKFVIFGFNASNILGTFQVENLIINGAVQSTTTAVQQVADEDNNLKIYPNPVTQNVNISYLLAQDELVSLNIYNVMGQQTTLITNTMQTTGEHSFSSEITSPGIYFVRLTIGDQVISSKFVKR